MTNANLKPKGVFWRDLSEAEKREIQEQLPKICFDSNYTNYRYYKTQFYKWIICNAMTVPMKLKKSFGV